MAFQHDGKDYTYLAGADLSAQQFRVVELNNTDTVTVYNGGTVTGVLQNKPKSGEAATVRVGGGTKAIASAAIAVGQRVVADTDGRVSAGSSGAIVGVCELAAGAAGDVVTVNLTLPGAPAQSA